MTDIEKLLEGIDLDEMKIDIDDNWYTSDELKKMIKEKIDAGEYDLNEYTEALKRLDNVVKDFQDLNIKISKDVIESFEKDE